MAAAPLPFSFTHQHSYYTHHKNSHTHLPGRALEQKKSLHAAPFTWGSGPGKWLRKMQWFLCPGWILCYCVTASGVKSLCRGQQQVGERPPTAGMAHQAFNLVRHVWHLQIYTGIFGKTSGWQWVRKPVPCGLKKKNHSLHCCLFWQHLQSSRIL